MPKESQSETIWAKPYLIGLLNDAVERGYVRAVCSSQLQARSLKAALIRIRRKADAVHAAFLKPEFDLVTQQVIEHEGKWKVVLVYNLLPDGLSLPELEYADEEPGRSVPAPRQRLGSVPETEPGPSVAPPPDRRAVLDEILRQAREKAQQGGRADG